MGDFDNELVLAGASALVAALGIIWRHLIAMIKEDVAESRAYRKQLSDDMKVLREELHACYQSLYSRR